MKDIHFHLNGKVPLEAGVEPNAEGEKNHHQDDGDNWYDH
jgi:hypothetical protein